MNSRGRLFVKLAVEAMNNVQHQNPDVISHDERSLCSNSTALSPIITNNVDVVSKNDDCTSEDISLCQTIEENSFKIQEGNYVIINNDVMKEDCVQEVAFEIEVSCVDHEVKNNNILKQIASEYSDIERASDCIVEAVNTDQDVHAGLCESTPSEEILLGKDMVLSSPLASTGSIAIDYSTSSDAEKSQQHCETASMQLVKRTRKRKCNTSNWKKNAAKLNRNSGLPYRNAQGQQVKERTMLIPCDNVCKYKCTDKISEEDRRVLFKRYWALADLHNQRQFVHKSMIPIFHKERKSNNVKQKKQNNAFYFEVAEKKIRVCKLFFTHTLGISDRVIRTVTEKNEQGFLDREGRGKHGNHRKLDPSIKDDIIRHIDSIPRMESHYLRAQTSREFIDGGKTLSDIHRDYVEVCKSENKAYGNYTLFLRIFNNNFNISFFSPKKDQCSLCEEYKNATEDEKNKINIEKHNTEKDLSRKQKEIDKDRARNGNCITACFDLQAVLSTPQGDINHFYYKSKLSAYNFTVYDMGKSEGHCYTWHEGEGARGVNEIGSCVYKYLEAECAVNKPVILYSDNCPGQNKNKFMMSLFIYAVQTLNIPSITHNFLVTGHTQNEGDAMHSLIEKQKKNTLKSGPVYIPAHWVSIIANAKKSGQPYKVNELDFSSFYDLKQLSSMIGSNFQINTQNEKVVWHDICSIQVLKDDPYTVHYKLSYSDESYKQINVRNKFGSRASNSLMCTQLSLNTLYLEPLCIGAKKYQHLMELCNKNQIIRKYHEFYRSLKKSPAQADKPCIDKTVNSPSRPIRTSTLKRKNK